MQHAVCEAHCGNILRKKRGDDYVDLLYKIGMEDAIVMDYWNSAQTFIFYSALEKKILDHISGSFEFEWFV